MVVLLLSTPFFKEIIKLELKRESPTVALLSSSKAVTENSPQLTKLKFFTTALHHICWANAEESSATWKKLFNLFISAKKNKSSRS